MRHSPYVTLNKQNLLHNCKLIKGLLPKATGLMAVVKADAYGHGLDVIANILNDSADVDAFAVARIDEAVVLRKFVGNKKILVLQGVLCVADLQQAFEHNIDVTIHDLMQLKLFSNLQVTNKINIWLKLDTGMHRLGLQPEVLNEVWQLLQDNKYLNNNIVLMSHFACADAASSSHVAMQISKFKENLEINTDFNVSFSIANSAAVFNYPNHLYSWVRVGLAIYGASPLLNKTTKELRLKPVMTFKAALIAIRPHKRGDTVGYGATWSAAVDTNIGVVSAGYFDGVPRSLEQGATVAIKGSFFPIVGRISMDMFTIDLGVNHACAVGDEVEIWGESVSVNEMAKKANTIGYELYCRISKRLPRIIS